MRGTRLACTPAPTQASKLGGRAVPAWVTDGVRLPLPGCCSSAPPRLLAVVAARPPHAAAIDSLRCPALLHCMQACASSTTAKRWRMRSWAPARTPRPAACRMTRCRASARPTWQPRRPCGTCCQRAVSGERFSTRDSAHAAACFALVSLQAGAPGRTQVAAGPCGLTSPIYCLLCRRYDSSIGVKGGKDKLWPATLEKGVVSVCAAGTAGTRAGAAHQPLQLLPRRWQPCSCMSARLCCARCKTSQPASQPQPSCTPTPPFALCPALQLRAGRRQRVPAGRELPRVLVRAGRAAVSVLYTHACPLAVGSRMRTRCWWEQRVRTAV